MDDRASKRDLVLAPGEYAYMQDVTQGFVVGKAVVAGVTCVHIAFRKPDVDWQLWIEDGPKPLPRKFVITSTKIAGSPDMIMTMTNWNTAPKVADGTFAFTPPKGARDIGFLNQPAAGAK